MKQQDKVVVQFISRGEGLTVEAKGASTTELIVGATQILRQIVSANVERASHPAIVRVSKAIGLLDNAMQHMDIEASEAVDLSPSKEPNCDCSDCQDRDKYLSYDPMSDNIDLTDHKKALADLIARMVLRDL